MPALPPEPSSLPEDNFRSELEELKFKTDQVTDDSLARTRRMKELCKDTKDAGIRTLVALDDQGGKMDNIEKGMEAIHKDMKEAKENLGAGSIAMCLAMGLPCIRSGEEDALWQGNDDNSSAGGANNPDPRGIPNTGIPTYGGFIAKYTNDAKEEEMNKNLEEVSNIVGNLRNMAVDMGLEIRNQNDQLGRVILKAEDNVVGINDANEKTHNLLK